MPSALYQMEPQHQNFYLSNMHKPKKHHFTSIYHHFLGKLPIGSMYAIYANIGGILMVNVTIYGIHGSYEL